MLLRATSTAAPALLLLTCFAFPQPGRAAPDHVHTVGVARIDITPKYPVRLSGFGFRRTESEGVNQRLYAKALAFGQDDPAVVLTVDNLGVSADLVAELAKRLAKKGVKPDHLAVTATHTHTAPMLNGVCATIFGEPIPKDHQAHIDRYTREFLDSLEQVALAALADRKPATLHWGVGRVGFAINRRTRGGPTDHDFPLLVVRALDGKLRALWVNYACHAVTLRHNKIGGDWPGYAQHSLEDDHPDAIALISIGCGADQNPSSGVTQDDVDVASRQGLEVAFEVRRLLREYLAPVTGPLTVSSRKIELPLADLPSKEEWEKRANRKDATGHHARVQLERLARGEKLRTKIDYLVQTWSFGSSLAMVFLPGEVVVDYSARLKRELDGRRLWLNAYANDAPCYIPSERILKEGGYEGGGAMIYYDVSGPFRPGLEDKIVAAVKEQLKERFAARFNAAATGGSMPVSPQQSRLLLRNKPDTQIELVAAEPLVASPVAIDFGPDGRLWVAEMYDYPSGIKGDYQPGGRIRVLEDTNDDGIFDKSTIFLDNIPFPTGVTVWRKGVLICAAPDILYAEDADGKGKATKVQKLYSGFGTHNYQARVNSLCYGLDGWVHGSCGIFGGSIKSHLTGKTFELGDRDFRIQPDTGAIEAATGRTQQGRVRDDQGNWFGCDNSTLANHLVLPDHYLKRNPHVVYPNLTKYVPEYPDSSRVYPVRPLQLFQLSGPPGVATGACGIGVYRDELLGKQYKGNLFVCESVNHVVHRLTLSPKGSTFAGRRAPEEQKGEFLASMDSWFRPVQVRTGPDGALWVVDMQRYVIEHPRWIPTQDLGRIDVRAGAGLGRIYRVRPQETTMGGLPKLDKLTTPQLVEALDTGNGTLRDLVAQMILWRVTEASGGRKPPVKEETGGLRPPLAALLTAERPEVRLHAMCVLANLRQLTAAMVEKALADQDPGVRRHAVRLAEQHPELTAKLPKLVGDPDPQVRLQLALTLGECREGSADALAELATKHADDNYLVAAVLSSVRADNVVDVLEGVRARKASPALIQRFLGMTASLADAKSLPRLLHHAADAKEGRYSTLGTLLDALDRRKVKVADLSDEQLPKLLQQAFERARTDAASESASAEQRLEALTLLGRRPDDVETLAALFSPRSSPVIQSAALTALARLPEGNVAAALLSGWKSHTPEIRNQTLDVLMSRPAWLAGLLTALEKKDVLASQLDATRRQRLLAHRDDAVRSRAMKIFTDLASPDREKVVKDYAEALSLKGDFTQGKQVFARVCSSCHHLQGVGHDVGPTLWALVNKSPAALLSEILDPNRNLDSRYVQYLAVTTRGQTFAGLLSSETATSISLRMQDGKRQLLLRSEIEELTSTGKSLMPDGLEKELTKQDTADLLAYLAEQVKPARAATADPKVLAQQILDDTQPRAQREKLIADNPAVAAELVQAMTADLKADAKEEYRRIPWIWRVSIAAGKRNDTETLKKLIDVSLPKIGEPLRDWQAVVIGGGVINGISLQGGWPRPRMAELIKEHSDLRRRWNSALELSATMADNDKVPTGTRYDALRMIALDTWEKRGAQLSKYLAKGTHDELMMGAVSGLSDVESPKVAELLLGGMGHYSAGNRKLALEALLRTEARAAALLDALEAGKVKPDWLTKEQVQALREHKTETLRQRAQKVLEKRP